MIRIFSVKLLASVLVTNTISPVSELKDVAKHLIDAKVVLLSPESSPVKLISPTISLSAGLADSCVKSNCAPALLNLLMLILKDHLIQKREV